MRDSVQTVPQINDTVCGFVFVCDTKDIFVCYRNMFGFICGSHARYVKHFCGSFVLFNCK